MPQNHRFLLLGDGLEWRVFGVGSAEVPGPGVRTVVPAGERFATPPNGGA